MATSPDPNTGSKQALVSAAAAAGEPAPTSGIRARLCPLCGGPIRPGQRVKRIHGTTLHALCPRLRSDEVSALKSLSAEGVATSRGVLKREVSEERTATLNTAMHWLYGIGWGALYGLAARRPTHGIAFSAVVWGRASSSCPP